MTVSVPPLIGETQPIIRIVEVLPAPFGPRKPNDSPCATSKSMASTAVKSPNFLVSPRAWMSEVGDVSGMGAHGTAVGRRDRLGGLRRPRRLPETCYDAVAHQVAATAPRNCEA